MSTFHVYVHTGGDYEAIPDGFSIPAALLGGAWAIRHRLWKIGLLLLAADGSVAAALRTGDSTWVLLGLAIALVGHGLAGLYGAYWRENSMNARGYTFVATVTAEAVETAIQRAMREERTPSADARETSSIARRAVVVPDAQSSADSETRFEMDFDRLRDPMGLEGASPDGTSPAGISPDGASYDGAGGEPAGDDATPDAGSHREHRGPRGVAEDDEPPRGRKALVIGAVGLVVVAAAAAGAWYYLGHRAHSTDADEASAADAGDGASADATAIDGPQPIPVPIPIPVPKPSATAATAGAGAATPGASGAAASDASADDGTAAATRHARPLSPAEIEAAWARHYKPAPKCIEPADWDTYVECVNTMMREREAFAARLTKTPAGTGAKPGKGP